MVMSLFRILVGVLAGLVVILALGALGLRYPFAVGTLLLFAVGVFWTWFIARSLSRGSVMVRFSTYLRRKTPVAYWFWIGFYLLVAVVIVGGWGYLLIKNWTSK
jgi:hypothetical protein